MDKIEDIRKRARGGESIASIARAVGASEPTVRKYARMEDLSPEPPRRREPESEVLAPYEGTIDSWLDDDCRNWRKQRHTATRVYVRLRDEEGYAGSYSTVQRYVKRRREEMARERERRDAEGFLTLRWLPGEVQVDFGEADFRVRGVVTRGEYLTVAFPHSNVGLTQVFWGETAECVCQGLRNVFEFVGGVPRRAVFDNATEVGRRVGGEAGTSELFRRFAARHGLDYTFTNPHSGNEKGSVENKVGCHRRNLFVPVPSFHDVRASDRRLPGDCPGPGEGRRHHGLGTPELELFEEDREALSPLPPPAFSARGGRPGGATGRARPPSAGCTATRPAPPTRAARSPSRSGPSAPRPATAGPARWWPPTGASGARPRPTARTRRCS
ncbi:IS21 family transposase [Thermophilibacter provencensis]|uniref:IS21 family transposase n=1 Tax=Thermophilibacter provencensis TaxID=1852386 RepID=UPI0023542787|nr:IS21 family transposase [Thermophilibacter provencensis]